MVDRPINFRAPMIRALLEGRKTQDRRVLKPQPQRMGNGWHVRRLGRRGGGVFLLDAAEIPTAAVDYVPYAIGDRLWVREADALPSQWDYCRPSVASGPVRWKAGTPPVVLGQGKWRPSINMPRWASRLTLIVTDVRVQRLQDISEADAMAEGIERIHFPERGDWGWPQARFRYLWNSIHSPAAWDENRWICALTFTVHRCNIDAMEPAQ